MRDFLLKRIPNENRMLEHGEKFARAINKKLIIFLYGQLGAGKTTFVRGLLKGLGYDKIVKSPTYTIVEPYQVREFDVYHFDLYRLKDITELEYLGIEDYFHDRSICLIEWPENGESALPLPDLSCYIEFYSLGRDLKWVAHTDAGKELLGRLIK